MAQGQNHALLKRPQHSITRKHPGTLCNSPANLRATTVIKNPAKKASTAEYGPIAAPDFARLSHCKGLGVAIPLTFFHTPFLRGHFHREIDYERKLGAGSTMRYCAIRSHHSSRQQPFAQSKNVWPACCNQVDIGGRALQGSIATSLIPSQINIEGHLDLLALQ